MIDPHSLFLLATTLIAVVVLILLISVAKLNPFLTLLLISLALAMVVGMPLAAGIRSFETGMGNTLGHIAIVVALGTMLGKMMAESGGADQVAHTLIRIFGEKRVPWAMMVIGLIVGLPAQRFGLAQRGLVREGYAADVVLFDADKVIDTATFTDPLRPAEGIAGVWVNGILAYTSAGARGARAGKFLSRGSTQWAQ